MINNNFNRLKKVLPNAEILVNNGIINIIPLKKGTKTPLGNWKTYQNEKYSIDKLKRHNGNYGIVLGYNKENTDYWLAGIDIDGFSISNKELEKSINIHSDEKNILKDLSSENITKNKNRTRQDLFNLLKDLKDVLIVKTANNGYHIYYWTKRDFDNKFIENVYYPKDYDIKILRNKSITYLNKHVEHYTEARQFVFPPSVIKQNKNESSYEFVSNFKDIEEFFENPKPKENVLTEIKEIVRKNSKGYIYREPKKAEKANNIKRNKKTTKYSNSIKLSSSLIKTKINNPDMRKILLNNILKAGYVQGNMNNLGYILICNFRRHGLSESEIYEIFKDLQIKNHDLNKVKNWIKDKFKVDLNNIENKNYAGLNALKKEIQSTASYEEQDYLINWFTDFFYDVISRLKDKPESRNALIELASFVESEYNIFKVLNNKNKAIYYYFDDELNTYKQITYSELGIKLFYDYGLRLPDIKYKTVLESCQKNINIQNNFIELANHYINNKSFEILSKKDNDILTTKKFYININDNENLFLNYNPDLNTINIGKKETFIEKTLKEILIPKDEPNNLDCYIDFLQRLGACIGLNNKIITGYLGGGYNGKTILNWLLSVIFNELYSGIGPEEFKKDHNNKAFENKHVISIDELDDNSFNGIIPDIKRFRGGGVPISRRSMHKPDYYTITEYGMLWLFSNEIPNIPLNETALFRSMDIITLPNIFVEKKYLNRYPNSYLEDKNIKEKLIKDIQGLNWLLNVAIGEYKKMKGNGEWFKCNQSEDETIAIITKNDYLLNFLALYTELDRNIETSNKEIKSKFESWVKQNNYKIKLPNNLSSKIGLKLKELYGDDLQKGRKTGGSARYKLRLKKDIEVEKSVYEINEDILEDNYYILNKMEADEKTVYNAIKNGLNTYISLEREYPDFNLIQILNNLEIDGLMFKREQTSLI